MGNSNLNVQAFPLSSHPWSVTSHTNILYDPITQKLAQSFTKNQIDAQEFQTYKVRSQYSDYLVEILGILGPQGVNQDKNAVFSCSKNREYRVLMERIQYRLPDLGCINFNTGLYILKQTLTAFKILFRYFGSVYISQDLIGFTRQGKCKVWMNVHYQNHRKQPPPLDWNNPEQTQNYHLTKNGEQKMSKQLFQMIENRMLPNIESEQRALYFSKKKQILCGDYGESKRKRQEEDEEKYEYSFSGGLIFVNVLCSIEKLDCKNYRVDIPSEEQCNKIGEQSKNLKASEIWNNKNKNKKVYNDDNRQQNGNSKLSLKSYGRQYNRQDGHKSSSRRDSIVPIGYHHRDINYGSQKNINKGRYARHHDQMHSYDVAKDISPTLHHQKDVQATDKKVRRREVKESVRVGLKNMYIKDKCVDATLRKKYMCQDQISGKYQQGLQTNRNSRTSYENNGCYINVQSTTTIAQSSHNITNKKHLDPNLYQQRIPNKANNCMNQIKIPKFHYGNNNPHYLKLQKPQISGSYDKNKRV